MARGHGRISSSIWEDSDFLALTQQQQRLYLFLISQPNLNHAGLLPLTLRRWARKSKGLTARELEGHLDALAEQQFIVLDEDTEELLIRTFVRNDGVWRMPKVMGAMVSGAMEIESHALRRALVAEMDRVPLDQLSDEPTKARSGEGPSVRAQVSEHIAALRKAFAHVISGPTETPSATPSETPSDPPPEGGTEGSTRAHAGASRAHSPAPAPAPNPSPVGEGSERSGHPPTASGAPSKRSADRPTSAPIDDAGFELTDAMRRWAVQTFGTALDVEYETAQFIDHHRGEGKRRPNWATEWQKWMRRSAKWQSERAFKQQTAANVVDLHARQNNAGMDPVTANLMAGLALLEERDNA